MQVGALRPYEDALLTADPLGLCTEDGRVISLDVQRWLAPVDYVDETVLARCVGPVLDVGCGPGRFVAALAERGTLAMGVDIAEVAVFMTRRRGLPTMLRSVFAPIPGEGRWSTVLLMDGNIGIGGHPGRLLARVRDLLAPDGRVLVETDPDANADQAQEMRFSQGGDSIEPPFDWAHVGLLPLQRYAAHLGYGQPEVWSVGGRTFAALPRRTDAARSGKGSPGKGSPGKGSPGKGSPGKGSSGKGAVRPDQS